jgi:hypothetical protein
MSKTKALLFAGMTLGLVAFVLPANALATDTILKNGKTISDDSITFTGTTKIETLGTGIECNTKETLTVSSSTIKVVAYEVLELSKCVFFGNPYQNCIFEQGVEVDRLDLLTLDFETTAEKGGVLAVTAPKDTEAHPISTAELKSIPGKNCTITTNDITLVKDGAVSTTLDLETNESKFITALQETGQVRVDNGTPAQGTKTPASSNITASVSATLHIEGESENTYTYGEPSDG